eukprot:8681917-Alexandrium_andersonii.AAC.1
MATLWPPTSRRRREGSAEIHFLSQIPVLTAASKEFWSFFLKGRQTLSQESLFAGAPAITCLRTWAPTGRCAASRACLQHFSTLPISRSSGPCLRLGAATPRVMA